jgi:hypothetical protein
MVRRRGRAHGESGETRAGRVSHSAIELHVVAFGRPRPGQCWLPRARDSFPDLSYGNSLPGVFASILARLAGMIEEACGQWTR